jgi:hypothetical protein
MLMELIYRLCAISQAAIEKLVGGLDYTAVSQARGSSTRDWRRMSRCGRDLKKFIVHCLNRQEQGFNLGSRFLHLGGAGAANVVDEVRGRLRDEPGGIGYTRRRREVIPLEPATNSFRELFTFLMAAPIH